MELKDLDEVSEHLIRHAADNYSMLSGDKLKIKIKNDSVLNTEVPENKQWEINIIVRIVEKNI